MYQRHNMLSSASSAWILMNSVPENIPAGLSDFTPQITGPEFTGGTMSIAIDNMDLDPMPNDLWWDQPFDTVPMERYGVGAWDPFRYQAADPGEYHGP